MVLLVLTSVNRKDTMTKERNYLLPSNATRNRKGPECRGLCVFNIFIALVIPLEELVTARHLALQDAY
jgi:hypothetical protein